jgi:hypothetical protein
MPAIDIILGLFALFDVGFGVYGLAFTEQHYENTYIEPRTDFAILMQRAIFSM